jgi:hypothetical protein
VVCARATQDIRAAHTAACCRKALIEL